MGTSVRPMGPTGSSASGSNMVGSYGYYYNSVTPNPHIHFISPNPHTHDITPNPHRHEMRFFESGSIDGRPRVFNDGCKIDCNVLIKMIYDSLNTELAGSKNRVTAAAKKGNWITANKIGQPICEYLENYYIYRVICYLRSRIWYTEYETLANVPTQLDVQPTGLILTNSGNNIVGPQGTEQQVMTQQPISHADFPAPIQHSDIPMHVDTPHNDAPPPPPPPPPQISYLYCKPPGGPCGYYQATATITDCGQLGIPGTFESC